VVLIGLLRKGFQSGRGGRAKRFTRRKKDERTTEARRQKTTQREIKQELLGVRRYAEGLPGRAGFGRK